MRALWIVMLAVSIPVGCVAYEPSMLNLTVPSALEPRQGEITIQHRFYGQVNEQPFQTFFGMDLGPNVGLMLRFPIGGGFEIKGGRIRDFKEYVLDLSYAKHLPRVPASGRLDAQYFTFKMDDLTEREGNGFFQAALQTDPLFKMAQPCINLGYDGSNQHMGLGLGLTVQVLQKLSLLGEYYPVLDRDQGTGEEEDAVTGPKNCFAVGIKVQTYGHHFFLMVGNSYAIGTRRLMMGADSNDLYFGFNIQRRLEF